MNALPQQDAIRALLRILVIAAPGAEAAIVLVENGRLRRLRQAQGPFAAPGEALEDRGPVDPRVGRLLAKGRCARISSAALGLERPFCALQPIAGRTGHPSGFLLLTHPDRRRLGANLRATMAAAAGLAAPLLEAVAPRPPAGQTPQVAPRAHRVHALLMIELGSGASDDGAGPIDPDERLVAAIADRLAACLAPGDRMARLDGGRFAVLAATPGRETDALAARLLEATRRPVTLAGCDVTVNARVEAVRRLPFDAPAGSQLALTHDGPRRPLRSWRPPATDRSRGGRLERELAEATQRDQMRLVYQAYVDLAEGTVSGVEALLRWRHPTLGELPPASFIPLAEATGLILPLGGWALRTALAAARGWPEELCVAVNVSALQFHQPGFVAEVETALARSGVAPGRLELEITETVLMRDNPATKAQLDALIARGVRIALDDFGTGYSALAYLARLPHHRIKLDRSFVQDLANPATLALVRAILALARKSGVSVTAEGVERPDQLSLVRAVGFNHAQGYFAGPPVADPVTLLAERLAAF